jgi:hypothetical protein
MKPLKNLIYLIVSIALVTTGCDPKKKSPIRTLPFVKVDTVGGYNIWLDGISKEQLISRIEEGLNITINLDSVRTCTCGDQIININVPGLIFEGHAPVQVRTENQGEGLSIPEISAFKNTLISRDVQGAIYGDTIAGFEKLMATIPSTWQRLIQDSRGETKTDFIKIAILDSGIDPKITSAIPHSIGVPNNNIACINALYDTIAPSNIITGFNFALNDVRDPRIQNQRLNNDLYSLYDTHVAKHGSRVAYILAKQFLNSQRGVKIIPMRVLNNQNKGDSFGIICGILTAKLLGAQIINMSLGYYGETDFVFQEAIRSLNDDTQKKTHLVSSCRW